MAGAILRFEPNFLSPELNDFGLLVEVRNSELKVVGRRTAPGSLNVKAPGKYYVLARLPAGQEITEEVEVQPNDDKTVSLAFDEGGVSQPGVDEVSRYLGLPERTLLPTEVQSKSARRLPPVAVPSMAPPVATAAVDSGEIAARSSRVDSNITGELLWPSQPPYDLVDQLLTEYAALTSPPSTVESRELRIAEPPPAPIRTDVPAPRRDLTPIDLYLRLFRGNALALTTRALPADQWENGFHEGLKGYLTLYGANEISTLQVIQPGRPTLNIVLPLGENPGCEVVIRRCSPATTTGGSYRDEVSVDVHIGNIKADALLRYRTQGMLTEAERLLEDKFEDPIAAAVGAYGLLKFGNYERRDWIRNLYNNFQWLPDVTAIEAECLALEGKSEESFRTFLELAERGLPLFTDGLIFALNRLELFTNLKRSSAQAEELERASLLLELLRNYSQFADLSKLILRYTGRMPHLPGAEPAYASFELEEDATVFALTLEAGDEAVVRAKQNTSVERKSLLRSTEEPHNTPEAVANLINANDPQRVALRLMHIASQTAEIDQIEGGLESVIGNSPEAGIDFLELANAARTVARIIESPLMCTGVMVSPHLLLTTHRVLPDPTSAAKTTIAFDYDHNASGGLKQSQTFRLRPELFFLTNSDVDFTLIRVSDQSTDHIPLSDFGFNRLNGGPGKVLCGESISIIDYSEKGPKSLQLRSGLVEGVKGDSLFYDTKTSEPSTGAPVFNSQWEILGLHDATIPYSANPETPPDEMKWVNIAIRISSILRACREASVTNPVMQELLDQVLNPPEFVANSSMSEVKPELQKEQPEAKEVRKAPENKGEREMTSQPVNFGSGTSATLTLPLQITLGLGAPTQATQPAVSTRESTLGESFLEKIEPDEDYDNRPGYNPNFLGFPVPLPKLSAGIKELAVKVSGSGHELKYFHYSVIMNGRRRLAFVSAGNLDAKAKFVHEREGSDKWFMDPRISEDFQAGEEIYSSNPLDRGHLVRRADAAWGRTAEEARLANDDTFHFTNCSPQHEVFNQSSKATKKKLLLWGNIENHIAKEATHVELKKVNIFNGPVFRQNDRKHRGLQIPREYWKIVVFRNDQSEPRALAFILSQAALIKTLPTEDFMVGPYEVYQVKVRELEAKTKLNFGELRDFDPLEDSTNEAFFEAATEALVVSDLRSIVL